MSQSPAGIPNHLAAAAAAQAAHAHQRSTENFFEQHERQLKNESNFLPYTNCSPRSPTQTRTNEGMLIIISLINASLY